MSSDRSAAERLEPTSPALAKFAPRLFCFRPPRAAARFSANQLNVHSRLYFLQFEHGMLRLLLLSASTLRLPASVWRAVEGPDTDEACRSLRAGASQALFPFRHGSQL